MYEPGKVKEITGNISRYKFILEQGDKMFWVISEWIVDISDELYIMQLVRFELYLQANLCTIVKISIISFHFILLADGIWK
jgi:hypothetical protein